MNAFYAGVIIGIIVGWSAHLSYVRFLWVESGRMRRKARGIYRRRR